MKIPRRVAAELFHADRQTDIKKLIVAFRNYANAPETAVDMLTVPARFFFHVFCVVQESHTERSRGCK